MLELYTLSPAASRGALSCHSEALSQPTTSQTQALNCAHAQRVSRFTRLQYSSCVDRKRASALRHCCRDESWPAFSDHHNRGMDEAENGSVLDARAVKRPRPDDLDAQALNGTSQRTALPVGKAPAVHTKALRSVLKGSS